MPEVVQGLDALPRQHRAEGTPDPADGDNLKDSVHAHGREGSLANEAIDALTLGGRHSVPELRPSLRHMAGHV